MVEFDHPHILLEDSSSMFHQMVQRLGDVSYKTLCEQALTSFSARRNLEQGDNLRGRVLDTVSQVKEATLISAMRKSLYHNKAIYY